MLADLYALRKTYAAVRSAIPGIGSPTLVVGLIQGGINTNVVPDNVTFRIDRRIIPRRIAADVEAALTRRSASSRAKWPGVAVKVTRILLAVPFVPIAGQERLVAALRATAARSSASLAHARRADLHRRAPLHGRGRADGALRRRAAHAGRGERPPRRREALARRSAQGDRGRRARARRSAGRAVTAVRTGCAQCAHRRTSATATPPADREHGPRPRDRVRRPVRRRQQVGVAQRVREGPRGHRRRSAPRAGSAGTRARYSQVVTAGASPNARLDGNCGKRTKAMASTSAASIRASCPCGRRRRARAARARSRLAPASSNAAAGMQPRLVRRAGSRTRVLALAIERSVASEVREAERTRAARLDGPRAGIVPAERAQHVDADARRSSSSRAGRRAGAGRTGCRRGSAPPCTQRGGALVARAPRPACTTGRYQPWPLLRSAR